MATKSKSTKAQKPKKMAHSDSDISDAVVIAHDSEPDKSRPDKSRRHKSEAIAQEQKPSSIAVISALLIGLAGLGLASYSLIQQQVSKEDHMAELIAVLDDRYQSQDKVLATLEQDIIAQKQMFDGVVTNTQSLSDRLASLEERDKALASNTLPETAADTADFIAILMWQALANKDKLAQFRPLLSLVADESDLRFLALIIDEAERIAPHLLYQDGIALLLDDATDKLIADKQSAKEDKIGTADDSLATAFGSWVSSLIKLESLTKDSAKASDNNGGAKPMIDKKKQGLDAGTNTDKPDNIAALYKMSESYDNEAVQLWRARVGAMVALQDKLVAFLQSRQDKTGDQR